MSAVRERAVPFDSTRQPKGKETAMAQQAQRTQLEQEQAVRDYIDRLTLMDDLFMAAVFEDPRCTETVLRVIMDKPDLEVRESRVKQDLINLAGRSAQVDVFAVDGAGKHYDIEVQRNPSGANARRARYYGAILDAKTLEKGGQHQNLPETYVIFITEKETSCTAGCPSTISAAAWRRRANPTTTASTSCT